jgi:hypothetical protein
MVHLGDVGQAEAHFGPFRDSVNQGTRLVHGLRLTYHRLETHFWHTQWYSLVMWVKWNLISVCLDIVLI